MKIVAVIPAGGLGTRLKERTKNTPKPLLKIGPEGKRIIDWALDLVKPIADAIYVTICYLGDQIVGYVEKEGKIEIIDEAEQVGSGHFLVSDRLLKGLHADDVVVIVPADHVMHNIDLGPVIAQHRLFCPDITAPVISQKSYGEYVELEGNTIKSVVKVPSPLSKSSIGLFVFSAGYLQYISASGHNKLKFCNAYHDIFEPAVSAGAKVHAYVLQGDVYWEDIGQPERFEEVDRLLRASLAHISR